VRTGDPYSARVLRESERRLRRTGFLDEVRIRPIAWDGERVDLEVATRDVWTLTVGLDYGRGGGANRTTAKVRDSNLLGSGKYFEAAHTSDVDRDSSSLSYSDPAVLGTRAELDLGWSENSDGFERFLRAGRPFYELDARWSAGASAGQAERIDSLYELGHVRERFRHRLERYQVGWGWSSGLVDDRVVRWSLGASYETDLFAAAGEPAASLPAARRFVYPWIGVERRDEQFEEKENLDQIHRTEDLAIGGRWSARLGVAVDDLGSTESALLFGFSGAIAREPAPRRIVRLRGSLSGRWNAGAENVVGGLQLQIKLRDFGEQQLHLLADLAAARRLDADRQLLLGGDSGLRGYPLRYQEGDRRALFTVEQRVYTDRYLWRLFHLGAAAFVDWGRTWGGPAATERGWLGDVGIGLRIGNARSGRGRVIHVDLAVPLQRRDGIATWQWLVAAKETF